MTVPERSAASRPPSSAAPIPISVHQSGGARPADAPFAVHGDPTGPLSRRFIEGISRVLRGRHHPEHAAPQTDTRLVLHVIDAARPRAFRRRVAPTFVVAVAEVLALPANPEPSDILRVGYPLMLRSLANVGLLLSPADGGTRVDIVTLEQGAYSLGIAHENDPAFLERAYDRIAPLALSRLVIRNIFLPTLPRTLWQGNDVTRQLFEAGQRLDGLGLLPSPFPLEDYLDARELRHVKVLFGVGGLSYGNLSAREDERRFWMSASGVDKSQLREVGRDLLLVEGYDPEREAMLLSVPPGMRDPSRASVDAIEHWMIYERHPQIGAIVHIHAWIDGIPATHMNYPCGTVELATEAANLVAASPDPARAIVGQKNHGLTITGTSLEDIFERIEGRVLPSVPMAA